MFKECIQSTNKRFYQENKDFLSNISVFQTLNNDQIEALLSIVIIEVFEVNEIIIIAGELSSELYLIKEGSVNIFKNNQNIITLKTGDYFGEQSILYNTTRVASAKANCRTHLLCFTKESLTRILGDSLEKILYFNCVRIAFSKDPILFKLTGYQVGKILKDITIIELENSTMRIPGYELWIVIKGTISENPDLSEKHWTNLDCIDSTELLEDEHKGPVELYTENALICKILKEDLEKCLGGSLEYRLRCNEILNMLNKIYIFKFIPQSKLEKLSTNIQPKIFSAGETIFYEKDPGDYCYMLKSGAVHIIKGELTVATIRQGAYFGERAILYSEPRVATARAKEDTELWVVDRDQFLGLLDENLKKYLFKKSRLQDKPISLNDLEIIEKISDGTYASTYLVQKATDNINDLSTALALKCIPKKNILDNDLLLKFISEKKLHSSLDYPFIATFVKNFKDSNYLYMLYEYIPGPTLSDTIEIYLTLSLPQVYFYSSVILLTLEYLHSINIIHREITSDSFLIDEYGYPMLTHFTLAKRTTEKTYTLVGVPYYLAPEVIKGEGYSSYSDI